LQYDLERRSLPHGCPAELQQVSGNRRPRHDGFGPAAFADRHVEQPALKDEAVVQDCSLFGTCDGLRARWLLKELYARSEREEDRGQGDAAPL
jgi:hypothetical protein